MPRGHEKEGFATEAHFLSTAWLLGVDMLVSHPLATQVSASPGNGLFDSST